MASCGLCKKDQREQFVSQSFVWLLLFGGGFTNIRAREQCSWMCPRRLQGKILRSVNIRDLAPRRCRIQRRISGGLTSAVKSVCRLFFFYWADLELNLYCAPPMIQPQRMSEKKTQCSNQCYARGRGPIWQVVFIDGAAPVKGSGRLCSLCIKCIYYYDIDRNLCVLWLVKYPFLSQYKTEKACFMVLCVLNLYHKFIKHYYYYHKENEEA